MVDLTQILRGQMLATLMEAMGGAPLAPGQLLSGKVASLPQGGPATLLIAGQSVQVEFAGPSRARAEAALATGQPVTLRIDAASPTTISATLVEQNDPAAQPASPQPASSQPASQAVQPQQPAPPGKIALAAAVAQAVGTQQPLGPLLANLGAVLTPVGLAHAPAPLIAAAAKLLNLAYDPQQPQADGAALKAAVARAGITHEALLATGSPADARLAATDLKAALLTLKDVVVEALGKAGGAPAAPADTEVAPPHPGPTPAPQRLINPYGGAASAPSPSRPPLRDGPLMGQAPDWPSIEPREAGSRETLSVLARQADGALDRVRLMQAASLPHETPAATGPDGATTQRWLVELPMRLEGQMQMLPLRIERETPRRASVTREGATWRVRFALEGEPLGALQAVVTWQMRQIGVSLYAEREATREVLRATARELRQSLTEADLRMGGLREIEIDILSQAPAEAPSRPGSLLDRTS